MGGRVSGHGVQQVANQSKKRGVMLADNRDAQRKVYSSKT